MKFILLPLGTFLLLMFLIYLKSYVASPRFNRWAQGLVEKIEMGGEDEIWTIKWTTPSHFQKKNPGGPEAQYFYYKFKHGQSFNNVHERDRYIKNQTTQYVNEKFYLGLRVDKKGIIRSIGKYDGGFKNTMVYGILLMIFMGVSAWFL